MSSELHLAVLIAAAVVLFILLALILWLGIRSMMNEYPQPPKPQYRRNNNEKEEADG